MRNHSVWLEVALNGAAGQSFQPGIPICEKKIIQEGIACANAGAKIVHLHAYDTDARPTEDVDVYSRIFEGILAKVDVILYPTLSLEGNADERYSTFITLAERGLLEWGVIDPGSVNIAHQFQIVGGQDGLVYSNPDDHIRTGLGLAEKYGWRPAYAIYEPGFARLGAAMAAQFPDLNTPIYRLMFSDHLMFGAPPELYALEFYAEHLAQVAPNAPWMISGLDANIQDLVVPALEMGAHLRVGLEDAPFGTTVINQVLVEQAVSLIQNSGYQLASINEIRSS